MLLICKYFWQLCKGKQYYMIRLYNTFFIKLNPIMKLFSYNMFFVNLCHHLLFIARIKQTQKIHQLSTVSDKIWSDSKVFLWNQNHEWNSSHNTLLIISSMIYFSSELSKKTSKYTESRAVSDKIQYDFKYFLIKLEPQIGFFTWNIFNHFYCYLLSPYQ